MTGRATLSRRLRQVLAPGIVVGLVAGAVFLASAPEETAGATATGTATSFVAVTDGASPGAGAIDASDVLPDVEAAAATAGGTISVVVLDDDGGTVIASGADVPTSTASLVKLLVVARLMQLDDSGALSLTAKDVASMEAAITDSDDDAMSALWVAYDGDRLVSEVAADLDLAGTAPPDDAGQWGRTTTTAADLATFLSSLDEVLDTQDTATLLGWMHSADDTAADGFDQAFGLLAGGAGQAVAVKQGWMCCVDDERQLHSAGVLADGRVVVLLGTFPGSASWAQAQAALDGAAAAIVGSP
jgi:beta-lactamase class A